jgi:hypothetical protein
MPDITINTARHIGKKTGAKGIVILQLDDNDGIRWASWGRRKAECSSLKSWCTEFFAALESGRLGGPW